MIDMSAVGAMPAVWFAIAAVVGLCVGSFLNVVIHRVPRMLERGWRAERVQKVMGGNFLRSLRLLRG